MRQGIGALAVAVMFFSALCEVSPAFAQKRGGVLKAYHRDTPPSASIHEEATNSSVTPYMGIYNNLVMYRQDIARESLDTIVPDLAKEWTWNDERTKLTFSLRQGVTWHDGVPFTAKDVKCTWDLILGKTEAKLRKNPRESWYANLEDITVDDAFTATFHLKRRQPSFIALLASGYSPVYPCHVSPKQMRTKPIGTGPFKFVSQRINEGIKLTRNPDYWKPERPYLDGIEWTIIKSRATRVLGFVAGKFDMTFNADITIPLQKDIAEQAPEAICKMESTNVSTNLIVNQKKPPFDNPEIRRALVLTIDRSAFNEILGDGQLVQGGAMMPPPDGVWGMPQDVLKAVAGYGPDVEKNRAEARRIMEGLGYGPDNRLAVKVATRNIAIFRDPAVIFLDQLREIYMDATLETVETVNWFRKISGDDYMIGMNLTGSGVDDPDAQFYENYACGSLRNYTGYCNPEIDRMIDQQSMTEDRSERRKLVWAIDRMLQEDAARPIILHNKWATCFHPWVKGLVPHVNSLYNGWRLEDVWLDHK